MNDILGEKFVDACVRRPFVEHMVCKRTNTTEIIKMRFWRYPDTYKSKPGINGLRKIWYRKRKKRLRLGYRVTCGERCDCLRLSREKIRSPMMMIPASAASLWLLHRSSPSCYLIRKCRLNLNQTKARSFNHLNAIQITIISSPFLVTISSFWVFLYSINFH